MQQVVSLCGSFIWSYNYSFFYTAARWYWLQTFGSAGWLWGRLVPMTTIWSLNSMEPSKWLGWKIYRKWIDVLQIRAWGHRLCTFKKTPRFTHFVESIIWVAISVENFPYSTLERFRWDFQHEALEISQITLTIWITVSMAKSIQCTINVAISHW